MKKCVLILFSAVLAGCATMTPPRQASPAQDTFTFNTSYDDVWKATVDTLAERNLPIRAIEKESGSITTDYRTFQYNKPFSLKSELEDIAQRPSVFMGTWSKGRYYIGIMATDPGDGTCSVKIMPHIEAFEDSITEKWYPCTSKGTLEKEIYDDIASKLK